MLIRHIDNPIYGYSSSFNTAGLGEVIVFNEYGGRYSEMINQLEVQLSNARWINMSEAFKEKYIIPDNYNTNFREPKNLKEIEQGYY